MKEIVRQYGPAVAKAADRFTWENMNRRSFLYFCAMAGFGFSGISLFVGCKKTPPPTFYFTI